MDLGEETVAQQAIVKLRGGSLLSWDDFQAISTGLHELEDQLDRARRLAAHLEEVVAMRTNVLAALVEWRRADGRAGSEQQLNGIVSWAMAQLEEIP